MQSVIIEESGKKYVYEIKLDRGEFIFAPNDTDSCVMKELFQSVRYEIGRRVLARVTSADQTEAWKSGRIIGANIVLGTYTQ